MKKIYILAISILLLSCGVRETQNLVSTGNYDAAIDKAIDNLSTRKDAKGKQDYIYLLEESFAKAKDRDENNIKLWVKENSPASFEKIYTTYLQLHSRQERIKPLLPLKLINENRNAIFPFQDYSEQLISSKNALSKYLYDNALKLLSSKNKLDFRQAYDDLKYLDNLQPNYKNVRQLIDEAQFKGTDFVHVYTANETQMMIPQNLNKDLLDFSTFGLNDKWTEYHNNKRKEIQYDFALVVKFREIKISPEQVKEKQFEKEKQIKDGTQVLLNAQGQIVKDSLGKPIMVDKFKTVRVSIYEFTQFKSSQVTAKVEYLDLKTKQLIDAYPISSEFIFEHRYATFNGDKQACDTDYLPYFDKRVVPFPTNEQMVYDTGEDLKAKLKSIITNNRFRRN